MPMLTRILAFPFPLPSLPEPLFKAVLAGGMVLCAGGALFYEQGYRRVSVRLALGCLGFAVLVVGVRLFIQLNDPSMLNVVVFLMLGVCLMLVPGVTLLGVLNTRRPPLARVIHAAMILTAYVMGLLLIGQRLGIESSP